MKFEYESGSLPYLIDQPGYLNITRDAGFSVVFPKGKQTYTLFYTAAGQMHYTFPNGHREILAPEGTLVCIPPHFPYSSRYAAPGTNVRLLQFRIVRGALPSHLQQPFSMAAPAARQLLIRNEAAADCAFLAARAYDLLSVLSGNARPVSSEEAKLRPALQALLHHYRQNHPVNYYAALCHMSESNFRRLFRKVCGVSPVTYRNRVRLNHARLLMESGEYTVEEAAEMCGFHNMSFFYQSCKREFGTAHLKK